MTDLVVTNLDDLVTIAFKVCTALDRSGYKAVLTGGSAATVYAPAAYQSDDLDYIANFGYFKNEFDSTLNSIGFYRRTNRVYASKSTLLSLEFPDDEIMIGSDYVDQFETLYRGDMILKILTPTDSVRDRLMSYFGYNSISALAAATGVAKNQSIDFDIVEKWAEKEGESVKYRDFLRRLEVS